MALMLQRKLKKYLKIGINVLEDVSSFYKYLTKGDVLYEEQIYFFSNNNHYDFVNSLPSFFSAKNYCTKCESAFNTD
jgi:choline kinase